MLAPLTAACLAAAAHAYQVAADYLYAILAVEGGRVGQSVLDENGTRDLGWFQIDTSWGPAIARFWGLSAEEAIMRVRDDGCANAVIAAAVLKECTNEAHGDITKALGLYHSHRVNLARRYRDKALAALKSLSKPTGR
jgi:hypothetical protein